MSTLITVSDGVISCVYDDRLLPLFAALGGKLEITRATRVEFEPESQDWIATHIDSGKIIGRGKDRSKVIQEEVDWLEINVIGAAAGLSREKIQS